MSKPVYKINAMNVANLSLLDSSFLIHRYKFGEKMSVPTFSYLITGDNIPPILVDTGVIESNPQIMERGKEACEIKPEMKYDVQLAKLGYKREDIKVILHTHLHIDHAGNDHLFPNAKIIFPRKELMFAVSGIDGGYPVEYITYLVEQTSIPGRVRLIDDDAEIAPGIVCELSEGHTWGSMNIKVNTRHGIATMCGDIIYNYELQCRKNPEFPGVEAECKSEIEGFACHPTGNKWNAWAAIAAIQKLNRESDIILPTHDSYFLDKYGYEL
ncbi:MAG: N-acyl homoserine lactonase family protein [Desulfitobacteriia bacterium]